jgi:DNA integrity scanning protein DisA with diadenylate cyclase activity
VADPVTTAGPVQRWTEAIAKAAQHVEEGRMGTALVIVTLAGDELAAELTHLFSQVERYERLDAQRVDQILRERRERAGADGG